MTLNSFQKYVGFVAVFGVLGLSSVVTAPCAFAQGAKAPGAVAFGSVDTQKVLTEYKGRQTAASEFQAAQLSLSNVLRRLDQGSARFLTDAEMKELAGLYEKDAATSDAEKKRIGVLEQKGDAAKANLTRLSSTATLDDTQKKQLADLTEAERTGNTGLTQVRDDFEKRLSKKGGDLEQKALGEVRAAVAKVAQDKGLTAVFDVNVAIYTSNDITADVVKQLNK